MSIRTVLFDLDGTLLPMDQELFVKAYFKQLAKTLAPLGYEPKKLTEAVWAGTAAMIKNDGNSINEEVFWQTFAQLFGEKSLQDRPMFDEFYKNEFQNVKEVCGFNEKASRAVRLAKDLGFRVALATNPIFPTTATHSRIRWAGLDPDDFELITTYENTGFSKPNPKYYSDIMQKLQTNPQECLMVGNDVTEDMVAEKIGIKTFLLTDCLINKENKDIALYKNGGFDELMKYLEEIKSSL
ncbi:MAG: HAD family hydrolase [Acutalibacteraceae bacterium]